MMKRANLQLDMNRASEYTLPRRAADRAIGGYHATVFFLCCSQIYIPLEVWVFVEVLAAELNLLLSATKPVARTRYWAAR